MLVVRELSKISFLVLEENVYIAMENYFTP